MANLRAKEATLDSKQYDTVLSLLSSQLARVRPGVRVRGDVAGGRAPLLRPRLRLPLAALQAHARHQASILPYDVSTKITFS